MKNSSYLRILPWLLAACAAQAATPVLSGDPAETAGLSERAAARFLDQATWGPTPDSISQLQQAGFQAWLKHQFALKTSDLPDQPILNAAGKSNNDLSPVQRAFFQNAVTGEDQLRQRVAFALSEIWVVSPDAGVANAYAYPPYWRIFRDHAFENYRGIVKAVTLNPAMGRYLNMANNNKANAAKRTAANENYARELMQLFTLGLVQLQPDGSPVLDQQHNAVPTYDQSAVTNLARAFTGWTYPTAPGATPKSNNPAYYLGEMFAVEANHDHGEKTIVGDRYLPPGQTAEQDLDSVLDALMDQPTMAPFVTKQLIQHLVTSNPSPAYVERVSRIFTDDGNGTRGNMKAVVEAILTDPEARAGDDPGLADDPAFGHMREPVLFLANLLRGLHATLGTESTAYRYASGMGQNLFYAPSVFSYFSPQYRTSDGLLGSEFQIYSTSTAAYRADVVNTILYGSLDKSTQIDLSSFESYQNDTGALVDAMGSLFLHGDTPTALRQAAIYAANAAGTPKRRVQAALYIVLTSGEYQIVH